MNIVKIYQFNRIIFKPLILIADYLQNNFTKNFSLMNVGTTQMESYKKLIKSFYKKNDFLVDCGCGVGHFCNLFDKKNYIGIEINNSFIKLAKLNNPKYIFDNFKGNKINKFKNQINYVLINNVIQHLSKKDLASIFLYIKKKTNKKKIKILIIEPLIPKNFFSFEFFLKVMDIGDYMTGYTGYLSRLEKYAFIKQKKIIRFEANRYFISSNLVIKGFLK